MDQNELVDLSEGDNDSHSINGQSNDDVELLGIELGEKRWRDTSIATRRLERIFASGFTNISKLLIVFLQIEPDSIPVNQMDQLRLLLSYLSQPLPRVRLTSVNTIEKAIDIISKSRQILVLTGAGISVSCGIPDFRSRDGIYSRLSEEYPDLDSPQSMFDIEYFLGDPKPFFKFAREIYPGQFNPSISHRFISLLESKAMLLRNYTQNIDTLEQEAGISKVIQCHGSFSTASCLTCTKKYTQDDIRLDIFNQTIPRCSKCLKASRSNEVVSTEDVLDPYREYRLNNRRVLSPESPAYAVIKPDIVFFGENLPEEFHFSLASDVHQTDLVIVMGSSLKVHPVACIPDSIPSKIPQILINREPLANHEFDLELYGDCDVIVGQILARLNWPLPEMSTSHGGILPYVDFSEKIFEEVSIDSLYLNYTTSNPSMYPKIPDESAKKQGIEGCSMKSHYSGGNDSHDDNNEKTEKIEGKKLDEQADESKEDCIDISSSSSSDDFTQTWPITESLKLDTFTRVGTNEYLFPGAEFKSSLPADENLLKQLCQSFDLEDETNSTDGMSSEDFEQFFVESLIRRCAADPTMNADSESISSQEYDQPHSISPGSNLEINSTADDLNDHVISKKPKLIENEEIYSEIKH